MKKVMSFVLVFALGLLCFANASAASAYSTTWRCTRPVEVTDLSSGIVSTEYIHAASVTFNYTITSGPNGFSGGIYKGMRVAPGKAASGTPSATSPSPVFAPSNDGTSITATFSGFNVTVNYHLRASKILLKILMTIVMATRTVHIPLQIKQCRALTLDKVREMRMVSSSAVD